MPNSIDCDSHDFVEIACLFNYLVELMLISGQTVTGSAKTIRIENKQEFLILINDDKSNSLIRVLLSEISLLTVLTKNAHFRTVRF